MKSIVLLLVITSGITGCVSIRSVSVVNVPNYGDRIVTKNKYCYVGEMADYNEWVSGGALKNSTKIIQSELAKAQPDVFSEDGIPFVFNETGVSDSWGDSEAVGVIYFVLYIGSCGLIPYVKGSESCETVTVRVENRNETQSSFEMLTRKDEAGGLMPTAYLFFNGLPDLKGFDKGHIVKKHVNGIGGQEVITVFKAVAYGLAARLREMEAEGRITDDVLATARSTHGVRGGNVRFIQGKLLSSRIGGVHAEVSKLYRVVTCERDPDKNFSYNFVLEVSAEYIDSLSNLRRIQEEFRSVLRTDYAETFPGLDTKSLVIDFTEFKFNRRRVEGRAIVLSITPTSLTYDSSTRTGKLTVRFNENQYEQAREWAKKNIETLVRDKNIALTTGTLPPDATYYSLGEKIEGNVMEIEFKTE